VLRLLLKKPIKSAGCYLLRLLAYLEGQTTLLSEKLKMEYILRKSNSGTLTITQSQEANPKLEWVGNKFLLEKGPNIKASNNYFGKKKANTKNRQCITSNNWQTKWVIPLRQRT